jgi:hypothetical protein
MLQGLLIQLRNGTVITYDGTNIAVLIPFRHDE